VKDAIDKEPEAESPVDFARRKLKDAGYFVKKVQRWLPPLDSGDPAEVLFIGKESGSTDDVRLLTGFIPERVDEKAQVVDGW
jgi:hypothetical protein